ncbi:MAG: glycosyltransferase family 1 protein [Candidatus Schekmanbacteria bacterium]|nr:MAG: glycosyltransferase family 1 protein [Candidatus Schekmanbacteria bacterium]
MKNKKSLKLSIICYVDISVLNAESIQIINFAKALHRLGHKISLFAPLIGKKREDDKIRIKYLPLIDLKYLRPLSFIFLTPFHLLHLLKKENPDAVICFDLYSAPTIIPVIRLLNIPIFLYLNSIILEDMKALNRNRITTFISDLAYRSNVKLSNSVGCISKPVMDYVVNKLKKPKNSVSVIKDAVDTDLFCPIDKKEAQIKCRLNVNCRYIGFVGSLCLWHGVDYLVEAAPLIINKNPDIRFLIVGDGEMKKTLQRRCNELGISDYFIWTGFIEYEIVPTFISAFDIAVAFFKKVRSNYGSPMKIFEYLSCAKPVLASNYPEYGQFVESLGAGISANPEDKEELSEKICGLLNNEENLIQMGKKGREAVLKMHTWEKRAEEMSRLINSMISNYGKN